MTDILYHPDFIKSVRPLPAKQQRKLANLIALLRGNAFHPLLHTA